MYLSRYRNDSAIRLGVDGVGAGLAHIALAPANNAYNYINMNRIIPVRFPNCSQG